MKKTKKVKEEKSDQKKVKERRKSASEITTNGEESNGEGGRTRERERENK